ncbi:hypothetical protein DE146DRAFT_745114 [Phaeosphaeria sp. MPI-PUGE-AT-0046c]|nr:hypothetical protein DE146DRAFT_745114 [Phaeosphaeria sp. MPI-PUGE-AT-0046c]
MATPMPQACERCWRRKQKCSRDFPCAQCLGASATCVQRRFGSTLETTGLGGLSYIEALKYRVGDLLARSQHEILPNDTPTSQQVPSVTPSTQSCPRRYTNSSIGQEISNEPRNDMHDTMQEASYLSLTAMAERTDRQPFPTEGLSFLTLLYAAIGVSGADPGSSLGKNGALSGPLADLRRNTIHLNDAEIDHMTLLVRYIESIQSSYPFMTKLELEAIFDTVGQAHRNASVNTLVAESPELIFLYKIVLATSILLSPDHAYKEIIATELASYAVKLLSSVFDLANDIYIVQCLTALTIYSMFTTFGGSTWHLLGLTMTRCVSSGMHTSRMSDLNSDDEEKRRRCRTFWTLYVLDTYLSSTLDRPCDNDVMVSPPHSKEPEKQGDLCIVVEHAQLLRSIRQQPETDLWIHYINLRHWYETVHPPEQRSQAPPSTLAQSRLLEHSQRGLILQRAEPDFKNFFKLLDSVLSNQGGAMSSHDAFHVFAAESNLVISNFSTSHLIERQRSMSQAINILTTLTTRYPPVRDLRDVLTEYYAVATNHHQLAARTRLRELIGRSEIRISFQLQDIMLSNSV